MLDTKQKNAIKMGSSPRSWKELTSKNITFIVTEDCNLRCRYCYLVGKNKNNKMVFEVAKKAVDYILDHPDDFPEEAVVWEFVGGEPFLEIKLIDKICDYIKLKMYQKNHKWLSKYMINMSSNGILYHHPDVQNFIQKNHPHLSIGISIDGNKAKHDLSRIYPDGSGSYDDVIRNIELWQKQFPNSSPKTTYGHDDLPYLKDSIIHLWSLGLKTVFANVVFEDIWHESDDEILELQLKSLADYIIENRVWDEYNCTFFSEYIGFPIDEDQKYSNWCGAGRMLVIDYQGKFYPCLRFTPFSLNNKTAPVIGDIENGYYLDRLRPYLVLDLISQSSEKCINCNIASGCSWCSGANYDFADSHTVYERAVYICKMHKARVRANEYFWNQLEQKTGKYSERRRSFKIQRRPTINVLISNQAVSWCNYHVPKLAEIFISNNLLKMVIAFAENNFYNLTFTLSSSPVPEDIIEILKSQWGTIIAPYNILDDSDLFKNREVIIVFDSKNYPDNGIFFNTILIQINYSELNQLSEIVEYYSSCCNRMNINLLNKEKFNKVDLEKYKLQLSKISEIILNRSELSRINEINILTDRLFLTEMRNCNAGIQNITLSPEGNFYLCPAFYYLNFEDCIGNLNHGINIKNMQLLKLQNSPICRECDAYHCQRCLYLNKSGTLEYNTPTFNQCALSNLERNESAKLGQKLSNLKQRNINQIPVYEELDPMIRVLKKRHRL